MVIIFKYLNYINQPFRMPKPAVGVLHEQKGALSAAVGRRRSRQSEKFLLQHIRCYALLCREK